MLTPTFKSLDDGEWDGGQEKKYLGYFLGVLKYTPPYLKNNLNGPIYGTPRVLIPYFSVL